MSQIVTVYMDLDTYKDITNLVQKRDEKRLKMKERYYKNKVRNADQQPSNRLWSAQMYQPPIQVEIVNDGAIFEPQYPMTQLSI